jgi:hypothetical protein
MFRVSLDLSSRYLYYGCILGLDIARDIQVNPLPREFTGVQLTETLFPPWLHLQV